MTEKTVTLYNTSEIGMSFTLRCEKADNEVSEFQISPSSGQISAHGEQVIKIMLLPKSLKTYSADLVVDVDLVGKELLKIPLLGNSVVPTVFYRNID
jgi:hypothetical protein